MSDSPRDRILALLLANNNQCSDPDGHQCEGQHSGVFPHLDLASTKFIVESPYPAAARIITSLARRLGLLSFPESSWRT